MQVTDNRPATILGRTIDEGAWSPYQIAVMVLGCFAFILEGVANQLVGLSVPALMIAWHLPRAPFAWLTAIGLSGIAAGNLLGGMLGDRIGRRNAIIVSVAAFGVMDLVAMTASSVPMLSLIRFIAGIGLGAMIPNTSTLIAEFTPQRHRALAVSIGQPFIPVGIVVAGFMASEILPNFGWQMLFFAGGIIPLVGALFFMFAMPESPRYLARDPAKRSQVVTTIGRMGLKVPADADISEPASVSSRVGIVALFAPEVRHDTLCLWGMSFFGYMCSYVVLSWMPTMLAGQHLGLAITSQSLAYWSAGGFAAPLMGVAIRWTGSRIAICGCALFAAVGALILMSLPLSEDRIIYFYYVLLIENIFVVSLLTAVYVVSTHIYPPAYRATGTGAASALGRIGAMTNAFTTVYALDYAGPVGYFTAMFVAALLCFLFALSIRNHVPKSESAPRAASAQLKAAE